MRIGEVLKLTPKDIEDRKAIIRDPKSGKEAEVAFLPQKVADRFLKYISDIGIKPEDRIFPLPKALIRGLDADTKSGNKRFNASTS